MTHDHVIKNQHLRIIYKYLLIIFCYNKDIDDITITYLGHYLTTNG